MLVCIGKGFYVNAVGISVYVKCNQLTGRNKMFVFVDGEEIYKTDITHRYTMGAINCEFSGFEDTVVEMRVLVHINIEAEDGAGFRKSIRII